MAEYIERKALLKRAIEEKRFVFKMEDLAREEVVFKTVYKDLAEFILGAPAADVAPIRRGKWKLNKDGSATCDQCHCTQAAVWDMDTWQNFCPNCGADMREVE